MTDDALALSNCLDECLDQVIGARLTELAEGDVVVLVGLHVVPDKFGRCFFHHL